MATRLMLLASVVLGAALLGASTGCTVDSTATSEDQAFTEAWQPAPVRDGNLRIVSFNIRNFPFMPVDPEAAPRPAPVSYQLETNFDELLRELTKLDFDVMGVQEIIDTALFADVVKRLAEGTERPYEVVFAQNVAGNPQHVGIVVDTAKVRIAWLDEHEEIDLSGRLRPGLSARLHSVSEGGADFGLMVLHLASGSSVKRADLRAEQAAAAAAIIAREIVDEQDADYIVLGDLNTARAGEEFPGLDDSFGADTGLVRQPNPSGCTSYWIKKSTNPLLRPAWLDHVYLASFDELDRDVPVLAGGHCAERQCQQFESTSPESGSTFYDVSDHCPVYFEIVDRDDDVETARP
jgi:endonuclease/exonuclease/phosphatase family metal-dependent hydrolase